MTTTAKTLQLFDGMTFKPQGEQKKPTNDTRLIDSALYTQTRRDYTKKRQIAIAELLRMTFKPRFLPPPTPFFSTLSRIPNQPARIVVAGRIFRTFMFRKSLRHPGTSLNWRGGKGAEASLA